MKILVVELARLGDIYQSWPALRALRRRHPDAQIDVITRPRFQAAFDGLEVVDRRRIFNTQELMGPLFAANMDVKASFDLVSRVLGEIKFEKYDWIINLSFSPLSSYITHAVAAESTRVSGYTRTSDGFLAIPDDLSAYFYAQVGFDRPNRFHLAEIFATMMEMDLIETDWTAPQGLITHSAAPPVLIHIGASEAKKQIGASKWATIINQLTKISDVRIGLIGSAAETENADSILNSVPADRVQNYVGKTNLTELFSLIAGAKLVVGPDSAPMHMASLVRTPCLNLSFHSVNFWETGPRAPGSYVLRGADESDFASDKVAHAIHLFFTGEKQDISLIPVQTGTPSYWALTPPDSDFEWNLVRALYQQADFPATENPDFRDAISKLSEINLLVIDQILALQRGVDLKKLAPIIDRGEEIIQTIGKLVPTIAPLIRWYQTEKIRLEPAPQEVLVQKSREIHELLQKVIDLYQESFGHQSAVIECVDKKLSKPSEGL